MRCRHLICLFMVLSCQLQAAEPPAKLIDLASWKLTLPYDSPRKGNPDEVVQPELAEFVEANCFHSSAAGDAIVFRASCGGLGTTNSDYPRCELREMQTGGQDEIYWATDDGTFHVMELEQAITRLPEVKQHVVCAQIHDKNDDVLMVRLEKKKLFVERNDLDDISLDKNYRLGGKFKLRIVTGDGSIKVWYNDELKMDWEVSRKASYFKAGCYTQSNVKKGDKPGAYGEVVIYRLEVSHRG